MNCLKLKEFIKCVEPLGKEHMVSFKDGGMSVNSIESSNQIIGRIRMELSRLDMDDGFKIEVGVSMPMFRKMLPKTAEVTMEITPQNIIFTTTGYNATMRTIAREHCQRVPTKPFIFEDFIVKANSTMFYEKISDLNKTFEDSQAFTFDMSPDKKGVISIGDADTAVGNVSDTMETPSTVPIVLAESYPYDTVIPCLDAVRHLTDIVDVCFMKMPGNDGCHALVLQGNSGDENNRISFTYVLAPRLKV